MTKKKKTSKAKMVTLHFKLNMVVLLPPPTALKSCPRCTNPHKKFVPLKFQKPMVFLDSTETLQAKASHWALCPKTKEPFILFDQVDKGESQQSVEDIAAAEDKEVLHSLSTWTASYPTPKKGKKGKEKQKPSTTQVTATFGPATTWVYDPNAPSRMVPGTKKEAAAQAKRVKTQVRKAKEKKR